MPAECQDVELFAGDDITLQVSVTDADGSATDLTGAQLQWSLAQFAGMPAILTKSLGSGIAIDETGLVNISLDHADTTGLQGDYWHQLVITDAAGDQSTVTTGTVTVHFRT